jgi:chromosome partitioning protein
LYNDTISDFCNFNWHNIFCFMIITVVSFKGGVGKTTSAVHLAAYLQQKSPTLLVDGDANRSASEWAKRGSLPFRVIDEHHAARVSRDYKHIVIDTEARPNQKDLKTVASGCDLMVIPTTPDVLALSALKLTVEALNEFGTASYRILITMVPPRPNRDGEEARAIIVNSKLRVFKQSISRLIAFQKAVVAGLPVYQTKDPRARQGWEEYMAVGKEILR